MFKSLLSYDHDFLKRRLHEKMVYVERLPIVASMTGMFLLLNLTLTVIVAVPSSQGGSMF